MSTWRWTNSSRPRTDLHKRVSLRNVIFRKITILCHSTLDPCTCALIPLTMLSLHRTIHPRCALLQRSVSEAAMREYHGDPGPSTVRRRQQSPSPHPRDGRLARVGPSRDAYPRSSLPSPRPFQAIRNSRFPASPRSPSRSPLGRHGKTSAVVEADAYDTSHRLKAWLRTRPELKTGQFDELMTFVSETPKNKVNAVVWNQVLGVLGQHGKMDRMWKAYNDVGRLMKAISDMVR